MVRKEGKLSDSLTPVFIMSFNWWFTFVSHLSTLAFTAMNELTNLTPAKRDANSVESDRLVTLVTLITSMALKMDLFDTACSEYSTSLPSRASDSLATWRYNKCLLIDWLKNVTALSWNQLYCAADRVVTKLLRLQPTLDYCNAVWSVGRYSL